MTEGTIHGDSHSQSHQHFAVDQIDLTLMADFARVNTQFGTSVEFVSHFDRFGFLTSDFTDLQFCSICSALTMLEVLADPAIFVTPMANVDRFSGCVWAVYPFDDKFRPLKDSQDFPKLTNLALLSDLACFTQLGLFYRIAFRQILRHQTVVDFAIFPTTLADSTAFPNI